MHSLLEIWIRIRFKVKVKVLVLKVLGKVDVKFK
jgi:hypothetical protein